MSRYAENKNLIQISNLSEDEIRALYKLPPNIVGVVITFFIYVVQYNSFAVIETLVTPILLDKEDKYTDTLYLRTDFVALSFITMGCASFFSLYIFKRLFHQLQIKKMSDRTYVYVTLVLGFFGSLMLIDFRQR